MSFLPQPNPPLTLPNSPPPNLQSWHSAHRTPTWYSPIPFLTQQPPKLIYTHFRTLPRIHIIIPQKWFNALLDASISQHSGALSRPPMIRRVFLPCQVMDEPAAGDADAAVRMVEDRD